jgi:hypothetical protein
MNKKLRALTAYEDTNMYGGAHCTNYDTALRAAQQGRDLVVHHSHYDGQRYHSSVYRVINLRIEGDNVVGDIADETGTDYIKWTATKELCRYAETGKI